MEFLGTKGKWEFLNTELADFILTTVICENQVVCHVNSVKENRVSNAQLIAHAPQMLEKHQNDIDILKSVIKSMPLGLQHLTNYLKEMVESKRQLIQSATETK